MAVHSKAVLRKEMLARRDSFPRRDALHLSGEISKRVLALPEVQAAGSLAIYLAKGSEVVTEGIIRECLGKKELLVPVTNHQIEFVRFTSFEDLAPGKFGVLEPKTKVLPSRPPDVVIVPGVAFDLHRHRLGYGKAYYDRLFMQLRTFKIGVCYDFQIVDKIPNDEHDQKLDMIVSEKRVLR